MVSTIQPLDNGTVIEVGMIGNAGLLSVTILLGTDRSARLTAKSPLSTVGA
jgi:hypothetical protein